MDLLLFKLTLKYGCLLQKFVFSQCPPMFILYLNDLNSGSGSQMPALGFFYITCSSFQSSPQVLLLLLLIFSLKKFDFSPHRLDKSCQKPACLLLCLQHFFASQHKQSLGQFAILFQTGCLTSVVSARSFVYIVN